jgi:hypothetical protein
MLSSDPRILLFKQRPLGLALAEVLLGIGGHVGGVGVRGGRRQRRGAGEGKSYQ